MPWVYIPILPGLHDKLIEIIRCLVHMNHPKCCLLFQMVLHYKTGQKFPPHCPRPPPIQCHHHWRCLIPPITEQLVESFGAHACYASLDLFIAYDQWVVHPEL
jgi:hypothetical protein